MEPEIFGAMFIMVSVYVRKEPCNVKKKKCLPWFMIS